MIKQLNSEFRKMQLRNTSTNLKRDPLKNQSETEWNRKFCIQIVLYYIPELLLLSKILMMIKVNLIVLAHQIPKLPRIWCKIFIIILAASRLFAYSVALFSGTGSDFRRSRGAGAATSFACIEAFVIITSFPLFLLQCFSGYKFY